LITYLNQQHVIIGGYRTHHEWEYTDWQEKIYEVIEKCLNLELITWWNLATPNEYKSHNRHDVINKWFYVYVNETDMLRSCLRNV
jgi:hypothetical protein